MRDSLDLGSAPSGEECAQVGRDDYHDRARRECRAYIHQLRRTFGEEPAGARLSIKANDHDFGTYWSVVCSFDGGNEAATDYAYRCESGPESWDEEARWELSHTQTPRKEELP